MTAPTTSIPSLLLLSLIGIILVPALGCETSKTYSPKSTSRSLVSVDDIQLACQATQHPETCKTFLSQSNLLPQNPTPLQIIQSALLVSFQNLTIAQSMVKSLLGGAAGNQNLINVAQICLGILGSSQYRISVSNDTLPLGKTKTVRAWMSAAVAYQSDCYGALNFQGGNSQEVNETKAFLEDLIGLSSNALSMIVSYDLYGNDTQLWRPPKTERDGFWEDLEMGTEMGFKGEFPSNLKPDVTVCKNSRRGCYKTVQEAVNATPSNAVDRKFVIHIKEGVYEEIVRVPFEKKNVVFLGDGMGKTIITGSLSAGQVGVTTYESATVGVLGDGFMASGITFQNAAGPPTSQAVAFRSESDLSYIENCEFLGNQDTLYAHTLRQFYKSCRIQGNVDFIFGNSAAFFQDCQILISPRQENPEKGGTNVVTAQGRTDPAQSTGFVFLNCLINGTAEYVALYNSNTEIHKSYLGRPWKEYSRVVYINSSVEAVIRADGWMPWNGDFALSTLYYGEYNNSGPGSNLTGRVTWSSLIPEDHIHTYSLQNFIQGEDWLPTL